MPEKQVWKKRSKWKSVKDEEETCCLFKKKFILI